MVVSQEEATNAIPKAIRRSRAQVWKIRIVTVASFYIYRAIWCRKTHLTGLWQNLCWKEESTIQIDVSEYMEKHNISRLIEAPSRLYRLWRRGTSTKRFAVVLMPLPIAGWNWKGPSTINDNVLLQIMEDGKLTDSFGRPRRFPQCGHYYDFKYWSGRWLKPGIFRL